MKDDFRDRSKLRAVDGDRPDDAKPRAWRRKALDEAEQVVCWQCKIDLGIETSATVEVTVSPRRRPDGRKTGGTKIQACAHCLARGKVTKLIG